MTIYSVYDEIAELLAQLAPAKILALKASSEMQERLEILIEKSKEGQITAREKDELDHYIVLERLVRLAKIHSHTSRLARRFASCRYIGRALPDFCRAKPC